MLKSFNLSIVSEHSWGMWVPGFGTDELRPYKRACTTEAHKQVGLSASDYLYNGQIRPPCWSGGVQCIKAVIARSLNSLYRTSCMFSKMRYGICDIVLLLIKIDCPTKFPYPS